jgi:hypothetical protein
LIFMCCPDLWARRFDEFRGRLWTLGKEQQRSHRIRSAGLGANPRFGEGVKAHLVSQVLKSGHVIPSLWREGLLFLFLHGPFGVGQDFFGYDLRDYVVVVHLHAVAALALGHAG